MDALILAAGDGTRLSPLTKDKPKPMIKIYGVPILERALHVLKNVGVKRAVIIIGYKGKAIRDYFGDAWNGIKIIYKTNDHYEDGILKSAIKGKDVLHKRFIFLCGDTIPDEASLKLALEKKGDLVVSLRNLEEDSVVADASQNGEVKKIGMRKDMKNYTASVACISINEPIFFDAIEACAKKNIFDRPAAMQWMIDNGYKVNSFSISNDALLEVDSFNDLKHAKKIIFDRAVKTRIKNPGIFKKFFNFPISIPLTKLIVKTPLRPNHITFLSLLCFVAGGILFSLQNFVYGGILCYIGAMFDAVDGKISRLKLKSSDLGKFTDSLFDRFSELSVVFGLGIGIFNNTRSYLVFLISIIAVFFIIGRFYIQGVFYELIGETVHQSQFWKGTALSKIVEIANRDQNFFVILLSCLFNIPIIGLSYLAFSSFIAFIIRMFQTIKTLWLKTILPS